VDDGGPLSNGSRLEGRRPKAFEVRYAGRHTGYGLKASDNVYRFGRLGVAVLVLLANIPTISVVVVLRFYIIGC